MDDYSARIFPKHDEALLKWFASQGWPVTVRSHDFDRDIFAWRHEAPKVVRTLRATRSVLEDWKPNVILTFLDESMLASQLAAQPEKYIVLQNAPSGGLSVTVRDSPPPIGR